MTRREILRGTVTAYPDGEDKGLVEVSIGAYDESGDKVYARVEQSMSGVYWQPEIGDAVEVELPDLPGRRARVVHIHRRSDDAQTGRCWTEKNDVKQLQTRSGHAITLDDTDDQTAITVHTAGGLELKLHDGAKTVTVGAEGQDTPRLKLDMDKDEVELMAGNKLTISCGGASIRIDSKGNVSIEAKGQLKMSGQSVTLSAQNKLEAKGQQVEVSGSMDAKLSGQSQVEVSSSGVATVKGSIIKLN